MDVPVDYPSLPKSSSHTLLGSVFGPPKGLASGDVKGDSNTYSPCIWTLGCVMESGVDWILFGRIRPPSTVSSWMIFVTEMLHGTEYLLSFT